MFRPEPTKELRCPYCGSNMVVFDEDTYEYVCYRCGSVITQKPVVNIPVVKDTSTEKLVVDVNSASAIHHAEHLVRRSATKFETIDLVSVVAEGIISNIEISSLIPITPSMYSMIQNAAYTIADYVVNRIGNYSKKQRISIVSCLAEEIMDAMRLPHEGGPCNVHGISRHVASVIEDARKIVRRYVTHIDRKVFMQALVNYAFVRHPGELVLLPSDRAYDLLSIIISKFSTKRIRCTLNKLRFLTFLRNTASLGSKKCGGQVEYSFVRDYVLGLADALKMEYGKLALTSALTSYSNITKIVVPEPLADVVDLFFRLVDTPMYWIFSHQAYPNRRYTSHFNPITAISDFGILVHDMNFYWDGRPLDELFRTEKKVEMHVLSIPSMNFIITKHVPPEERSPTYLKLFLGGMALMRVFLKRNYPEIYSDMPHFRLVTDMMKKHLSIKVPPGMKRVAEIVRNVVRSPPDRYILKYEMLRLRNIMRPVNFYVEDRILA